MTESTSTEPSRETSYLEWRQRLADRQAVWREPEETAPKLSSEWDPAALFVRDEAVAAAVHEASSEMIDLRDDPPSVGASGPTGPAVPAPAARRLPTTRSTARTSQTPPTAKTPPSEPHARPAAAQDTNAAEKATAERPEPQSRPAAAQKQAPSKAENRPSEPEPLDRQGQFDSVMARLERRAARAVPKTKEAPPIADALRELNQRRIEGQITDEEFKARKAELFGRSSTT